jgi:spore germination protein GerM
MEEQKSVSRSRVATTISALAVVATIAGGGVAWFMTQDRTQSNSPSTITSSSSTPIQSTQIDPATVKPITVEPKPPTSVDPVTPAPLPNTIVGQKPSTVAPAATGKVKVFWLDDQQGKKIKIAPQERIARSTPQDPESLVKESLTILLASAGKEGKQTSTIPAGTKLLSSNLKQDGLHIDLSKEFSQGGGSTSMQGRIAQILYTATNQSPETPVWISVEGKQLETLGGEGVEVKQPLTRQSFQQEFKDSVGEQ